MNKKTIILSTMLVLSAATVFAATQTKATQDKPWQIYALSKTMSTSDNSHSFEKNYNYPNYPASNLLTTIDTKIQSATSVNWLNGLGGGGAGAFSSTSTLTYADPDLARYDSYSTMIKNDSISLSALGIGSDYQRINTSSFQDGHASGNTATNLLGAWLPAYVTDEHCDVTDSAHPPVWLWFMATYDGLELRDVATTETYKRNAQAVWHVQTGGKAIPGRQSLCQFGAAAWKILDKRAGAGASGPEITNKTQIAIGALGNLAPDGSLWTSLPDGTDVDVTPKVAGEDFYSFTVGGQEYPLTILARSSTTNADLSTDTPEFCVGQTVSFVPSWSSGAPAFTNAIYHWHLPTKFVNEFYAYSTYCNSYRLNTDWLTNRTTSVWYVNGNGGACSIGMSLQFASGQTVPVAASGGFSVYRPSVNRPDPSGPFHAALVGSVIPTLQLASNAMQFSVTINSKYSGSFGLSQLVKMYSQTVLIPPDVLQGATTWGNFHLDINPDGSTQEYYDGPKSISQSCQINDAPGQPLIFSIGDYNGNWKDYVRFIPDGGIPITLGRIDWNWAATALDDQATWWTIMSDGEDGPTLHDDDSFPVWNADGISSF